MKDTDISYLIPPDYYVESLPTGSETELTFIGQENILFLSSVWYKRASELLEMGVESGSIEVRMCLVSESQECREYGDRLREIAAHATSKPMIFQKNAFRTGDFVTCFVHKPSTELRGDLKRSNRFLDTVIMGAEHSKNGVIYSVMLRNPTGKSKKLKKYRFVPDGVSAIASKDFAYFKSHPNFFKLFLEVHARNQQERDKIEPILSAL